MPPHHPQLTGRGGWRRHQGCSGRGSHLPARRGQGARQHGGSSHGTGEHPLVTRRPAGGGNPGAGVLGVAVRACVCVERRGGRWARVHRQQAVAPHTRSGVMCCCVCDCRSHCRCLKALPLLTAATTTMRARQVTPWMLTRPAASSRRVSACLARASGVAACLLGQSGVRGLGACGLRGKPERKICYTVLEAWGFRGNPVAG